MNGVNISPKRQALKFLQEALDTGVRGNVRTHIKAALDEQRSIRVFPHTVMSRVHASCKRKFVRCNGVLTHSV